MNKPTGNNTPTRNNSAKQASSSVSNADFMKLIDEINSKIDSMSDKFSNLETKLESFNTRVAAVEQTTHDLEAAASHTGAEIDTAKRQINNLIKKDATQDKDYATLESEVKRMRAELKGLRVQSNIDAQYHRNAANVIVGGIPAQEHEDLKDKLLKLTSAANFTNFNITQIDMVHRFPTRTQSDAPQPIIVRFTNKSDRLNFWSQKDKLKGKSLHQLGVADTHQERRPHVVDQEISFNPKRKEQYVYFSDSLTSYNGQLLKEAKVIAKELNYKFAGYSVRGEVRVKQNEDSNHIYSPLGWLS